MPWPNMPLHVGLFKEILLNGSVLTWIRDNAVFEIDVKARIGHTTIT